MKFFIQQWAAYKKLVLIGLLLSIIVALSSVALLSLSGWFIAASAAAGLSAATAAQFNYFIPSAVIRFLALTRIISRYADRVINHDITLRILVKLRVWFYQLLIPLSPAKLFSQDSGVLLNHFIHDIDTLDHFYLDVFSPFLTTFILIVGGTIFISYFSLSLGLIVFSVLLSTIFLLSFVALFFGKKIGAELQLTTEKLRSASISALQGRTTFALFMKRQEREKLIDAAQKKLTFAQHHFALLKGAIIGGMTLFSGLSVALLLWLGKNVHLSSITLSLLVLLLIGIFEQITTLPLAILSLGTTRFAAKKLLSLAAEKPAVLFLENSMPVENTHLSLHTLCFHYPEKSSLVISNFSLEIPARSHIGITGPSGAGKSTLLGLIARLWDPTAGEILLDGVNLKNVSEERLRKTILFVTQHTHIFNASIKDNLTLMNPIFSDEQCFDLLEKMDLAELVSGLPEKLHSPMGEFGSQFSGGQIRRIGIARALLYDSPILLLDEPSTGLDEKLFEKIWRNCEPIFSKKTLIVATHDKKVMNKMMNNIEL